MVNLDYLKTSIVKSGKKESVHKVYLQLWKKFKFAIVFLFLESRCLKRSFLFGENPPLTSERWADLEEIQGVEKNALYDNSEITMIYMVVNDVRVAIIAPRVLEPYLGPSAVAHNTLRGFLKIKSELEKRNIEIVFLSINDKNYKDYGRISVRKTKRISSISFTGEIQAILSRPTDNFEVVHSHSLYDIFPWLLKKDVAKIFHLHGIVWKEKKYYNTLGKFFAWLYEKRLRIYYPRLNKVIAVSSYVIGELNRKGFDTSKAVLIENVGDEFFEVKKNEERIILYPAVLNPLKNQLGFLKALASVKNEIGDFKVVFAGSGDKAYVEKLKDFVKKENLNVGFAGRVPYGKMPELYSKASIVALCSFQETASMVSAEAMASVARQFLPRILVEYPI